MGEAQVLTSVSFWEVKDLRAQVKPLLESAKSFMLMLVLDSKVRTQQNQKCLVSCPSATGQE